MPQRQVDHVAVVRILFARGLRQVEPEAMDELHVVLGELRSVGSKVKHVGLAVRTNDAKAELTPRPVRHLFPGTAELCGLRHRRQHRGAAGDDLDRAQLRRREDRGLGIVSPHNFLS
jgi:hypothetical protein